jgi:antirestriction protein ArdC
VPCFKKEVDEETGMEKEVLSFFKLSPVFMVEDTEGEPLDYEQLKIPELPLTDRAKQWGVSIKAIPGNYRFQGYYSPDLRMIALATPEEIAFFHELAHLAHGKVKGKLNKGQDPFQEIVAELSAQALCRLVGKKEKDTTGNSFQYIQKYAAEVKMSVYTACLKVLSETEKVLNLILSGTENNTQTETPQPLKAVGF